MTMSEPFGTYLFEYHHDGASWMIEIKAASMEDAQARMKKMPLARPLGQNMFKVPASCGFFVRCFCAVKNFFSKPSTG
jgi:hypothetical protein